MNKYYVYVYFDSRKLGEYIFGDYKNEKGEIKFINQLPLISPGIYKRLVFEFDENTFDLDLPFECQIQNILGINISKDDYYLSPESYL